ncbi:MAG: ATP-binding protein [Rhodothermaceae bacterium]
MKSYGYLLKKLTLVLVFFVTGILAQKVEVQINDKNLTDFNPELIELTPSDKISVTVRSEEIPITDLNMNLFMNGNEINYTSSSPHSVFIDLGKLKIGSHIFNIIYNNPNVADKVTLKLFVKAAQVKKVEKKETHHSVMENQEMFSLPVIILTVVCLILLMIIVVLYRGKGKAIEKSDNNLEEFNQQLEDLESAFEACKKSTMKLNEKNQKLNSEISSLEKNINELEDINLVLIEQKEKLQTKKNQLEALQKQKDELFAMAVHDIKNPASVIQSLIQLMESYYLTATEQSEIMQTLVESTQNIIKLSREMTEVIARQKEDKILDLEEASIKEIIDSVVTLNSAYAKKKNIKLLNRSSDALPNVKVDTLKIKEVIDNLVNNAIKYGPEKTIVEVKAYFSETRVTVEVSDTGAGLSEHDLKLMFAKGVTLSTKPTGGEHSSGLGLWLAKKIVEEHGGKIWAKSKLGVGTKFFFELPL